MTSREALNRAIFRGARIERRTDHHVLLRRGERRTTIPMYPGHVPWVLLRHVERDLGIDLIRPVRMRERVRPIGSAPR